MKNVLITGGCGFIGANLVKEIEATMPEVNITVIDDFRLSSFKNLLGTKADVLAYNLAEPAWMGAVMERTFDTIIHLASITDTTVMDERKMMFDNVEGFRTLLDFAVEKQIRVVYASSAAVYGSQNKAMKEEDGGYPNNIYGFSKWSLENAARFYYDELESLIGLRFFNVFGPFESFKGMPASMVYHLYNQMKEGKKPRIFYDGEQKRDFVYVKDIVKGILCAANTTAHTVCNLGSGQANSFNQLVDYINEAMGTSLETEYFENPYDFYQNFTQADLTHTTATIGYTPDYTTREGVIDYVQNYLMKQ